MDGGGAPADFEQLAEQLCAKPEIVPRSDGRFKAKCAFTNVPRKRYAKLDTTHTTRGAAAEAVLQYLRKGAISKIVQGENSKVRRACGLLLRHLPPAAPCNLCAACVLTQPPVPPAPPLRPPHLCRLPRLLLRHLLRAQLVQLQVHVLAQVLDV